MSVRPAIQRLEFRTFHAGPMPVVSTNPVAMKLLRIGIEAVPRDYLGGFVVRRPAARVSAGLD